MNRFLKLLLPAGVLLFLLVGGIFITHLAKAAGAYIVNGGAYDTMEEALAATLPSERGTVKGEQVAKIKTITKVQRGDYWIEIVDMKPRKGGVDVYAKAWDKNNNQIGFGTDGSVEIEHFVIVNPPILVPDDNGTVIRKWNDADTGELRQRKLREDPREALLQTLEHTLKVKKQKYGPAYIVPGKIGNTTLTAYPQPGVGTAPVDGYIGRRGVNETFATIRAGAGTETGDDAIPEADLIWLRASATTNQFQDLIRATVGFDTSSIGTDGIDSAILSAYIQSTDTGLDDSNVSVVSSAPADESDLVNSDYSNYGSTKFATAAVSSFSTSAYKDLTLNSSGEAHINKSGNTFYGYRPDWDIDNNFTGTWSSGGSLRVRMNFADYAGTSQDPKLVVEHSPEVPVLSNLQSSSITTTSAVITWTTDLSSDSEVTYDTSSPVTDGDPSSYNSATTTSHSITLSDLTADTTYYFFASSTASGMSGTSTESSFTTTVVDIEDLHPDNIGSGWADIKWTTGSASNSKVWYSLTSPVSATNFTEVIDATATTSHSVYLPGLLHNAIYYYIASSGSGGSFATSSEKTFNTTSTALCSE